MWSLVEFAVVDLFFFVVRSGGVETASSNAFALVVADNKVPKEC